jgi:hypothetical protein
VLVPPPLPDDEDMEEDAPPPVPAGLPLKVNVVVHPVTTAAPSNHESALDLTSFICRVP